MVRPVLPPDADERGRELAYAVVLRCIRGVETDMEARHVLTVLDQQRSAARMELRAAESCLLDCAPEIRGRIHGYDEVLELLSQEIEQQQRNREHARIAAHSPLNRAALAEAT